MSKLVSKWASEEEFRPPAGPKVRRSSKGGSREEPKDVNTRSNEQDTKLSKSITSEKSKPLVSKWATVDDSDQKKDPDVSGGGRSSHMSKKKQPRNRGVRDDRQNINEQLPSPPSTGDDSQQLSNRFGQFNNDKQGKRTSPRKPRKDRLRKPSREQSAEESEDEDEPTSMSEAGMSFAARLGLSVSPHDNNHRQSFKGPSDIQEIETNDAHDWSDIEQSDQDVDEHQSSYHAGSDSDDEKPPMTEAAKSLAGRLGLLSVEEGSQAKPSQNSNTTRESHHSKRRNRPPKKNTRKENKEDSTPSLPKNDEKLNEEIKDLFNKLTDKSANWADLVDE
ncbi:Piso0_002441 [Millerozyma farinosa CBS 7064]|uniref:Piso0_002441 protein n=1 Tax=Pichia sorbitophila (strain ATCC MYA-4447 / BCRC 22081 / CBS 7064 / NBRC 10061 / NRRL Y-12695) TaxID=559304 RepID=G8YF20_PICSO|nr:Piso0_002441 [Millerozyma farinosa CBS 7064]